MIGSTRVFAIATLLDPRADRQTHELWYQLERGCDLRGIRVTPTPHFSWMGARGYDNPQVPNILSQIAANTPAFKVKTTGLGLFTGSEPVLYLPIVKTQRLIEFHEYLWSEVTPFASIPNGHYHPEKWIPHITLAYRDITPEKISCAVGSLLLNTIELEIKVDHIALLYAIDQEVGLISRDDFLLKEALTDGENPR